MICLFSATTAGFLSDITDKNLKSWKVSVISDRIPKSGKVLVISDRIPKSGKVSVISDKIPKSGKVSVISDRIPNIKNRWQYLCQPWFISYFSRIFAFCKELYSIEYVMQNAI